MTPIMLCLTAQTEGFGDKVRKAKPRWLVDRGGIMNILDKMELPGMRRRESVLLLPISFPNDTQVKRPEQGLLGRA